MNNKDNTFLMARVKTCSKCGIEKPLTVEFFFTEEKIKKMVLRLYVKNVKKNTTKNIGKKIKKN